MYSSSGYSPLTCFTPGYVDDQGVATAAIFKFPNYKYNFDLSSISESQNGKGLTLKVVHIWTKPSNERSFGIKNIRLYMTRNRSEFSDTNFPCGYNFFWDNYQGCSPCHQFCKACTGTTNKECTSCNLPYYKYSNTSCFDKCSAPFTPTISSTQNTCNKICSTIAKPYYLEYSSTCSPSCDPPLLSNSDQLCSLPCKDDEYLYPDNKTCSLNCFAPFQQETVLSGLIKICTSTCSNYLYANGSCQANCLQPLLTTEMGSIKACYNPCNGTLDYLYQDSSCSDICDLPLKVEVIGEVYYCKNPCEGTNYHLYPDGTCLATCEFPLTIDIIFGVKYCKNLCSDYIYPDNSCIPECELPLKIETIAGIKYCRNSCTNYIYPDNSCLAKCDIPLVIDTIAGIHYCRTSCTDYIYPDKSCMHECKLPLKVETIGGIHYCLNSCAHYIYPDNSCVAECKSPLQIVMTAQILYCQTPCLIAGDFIYPDKSCKNTCLPPLSEKIEHNIKYCSNSCQDTEYLLWNGTCSHICPDVYLKSSIYSRKFCDFPCLEMDFLYWNGTCKPDCPFEEIMDNFERRFCNYPCVDNEYLDLNTKKCLSKCSHIYEIKIDQFNKKFCINDCTDIQYLYSNGTCEDKCVPPFKIHITNDFKKFCVSTESLEETSISVKINGQITKLVYIEKTLNAVNEAWTSSSSHDFTLFPTWTFFGLNPLKQYSIDHWDTTSSCGCFKQVCGTDCQQGSQCHNTDNNDIPWICHPWSERKNYCWSIVSSAKKWFMSYSLTHISTIALTSYGGLDTNFVQPGFTITNKIADQNYAINAIIMDFTPRQNLDLQKSYLYAESEGRVITITEFEGLNNIPTIQADLKNSSCNSTHVSLPLTLLFNTNEKVMPFHSYIILRQAKLTKMTILSGINILSLNGVVEWNNQEVFHFLDPCNQQFLTLQKDPQGNFFVKLPASQRLANMESIICIAVQDQPHLPNDLVLYEIKIGTLTWISSHRFTGILSKDYIGDLSVRLTTKVDPIITLPQINVDVQFHIDVKPPLISISTSSPTTCQLYLSPSCTYTISTDTKLQYISKSIEDQCGYLYEKAAYNCEGLVGYFFPPANLTKTRIDNLIMLTTSIRNKTEIFSVSSKSHMDDFQRVYFWLIDWTWQNCLTKLLVLFIVVSIISGMLILIIKFPKTKKSKAFSLQKNYNIVFNPHNDETAHVVNPLDNDDSNNDF